MTSIRVMLPKELRLRNKRDFDKLWKRGRSLHGRLLGIRFAPNQKGDTRLGIVIGVKIHKRATKRNTAKRRIREALRREYAPRIHGFDIAVIGRSGIIEASYKEITDELGAILTHAHLLS